MKNKTIIMLGLLIGLMFIPFYNVDANIVNSALVTACSASERACAVCTYSIIGNGQNKVNHGTITYMIKSDGSKVTKTLKSDFTNDTGRIGDDKLSSINFIYDSTNKLKCPSSLDIGMYPGQGYTLTYFDIYLDGKCESSTNTNYACVNGNLLSEDSYNNDKTISSGNEDVISCKYETSIINGQSSSEKVTGFITVNNGVVEYEFTNGYVTNTNIEKIPASKFTKDSCPNLYFSCAWSGSYKACSFQLENSIRPGTENSGTQTETAEDLEDTTSTNDSEETEEHYNGQIYCNIFGENTWKYVKSLYKIIKICIPFLIIILGMLDFMKVLLSGEQKDMKLAGQRFMKRIIAGVVLLLIPVLLKFLFNVIGFSENCLQQLFRISLK